MKQSPLNPKPIKLSHCEACVFLGNALREYFKNETREERIKRYGRFRRQTKKITNIKLNKKYENFSKIINSIRLKIDNLEK